MEQTDFTQNGLESRYGSCFQKIMLKIHRFTNRKCGFGLYKPAAWVYSHNMENLIKIQMQHLPLSKKTARSTWLITLLIMAMLLVITPSDVQLSPIKQDSVGMTLLLTPETS